MHGTLELAGDSHLNAARDKARSIALADIDVSPGLSMPNRFTSPPMPCSAGPATMKSAGGSPGPLIFGRMPA